MIIYPFKEEAFVTKALSEKRISLDFLDTSRRQALEDFSNYTKPIFFFGADEFLILISEQVDSELQHDLFIDLHQVSQFGWYYEKRHRVNAQIFASTDSIKINNLLQLNPQLRIDSFDRFRDDYQARKTLNVLSGALALCYHCFRPDYDDFFSKLTVDKSSLKVARSELDPKNDFVILLQLLLIHNPSDSRLNRTLFPQEKALHLLYDFLAASFRYFYSHTYSMSDFLSSLSRELSQNSEYSSLVKGFRDLNELYVQKGLPVTPPNKLIATTREFLDIAKTESDKLRSFLDGDHSHSKTAIFLLGMLHLGDRLEEQFAFNNFIPSLVDIAVRHTKDIKITADIIEFELDQSLTERNPQLISVADYLAELRRTRQLLTEINRLKSCNLDFKEFLATNSAIASLRNELELLKNDKAKLESEKDSLQSDVLDLKNEITSLQSEQTEREAFHKDLLKENESLTSELTRLQSENSRLKSEVGPITPSQSQDGEKQTKAKITMPRKLKEPKKKSKKSTAELFPGEAQQSLNSPESSPMENNRREENTAEDPHGGV